MRIWRLAPKKLWGIGFLAILFLAGCVGPRPAGPVEITRVWPEGRYESPWQSPIEVVPEKQPGRQGQSPAYIGSRKIVIDPGHGGKDPGAQGLSILPEKTIVLAIAKELNMELVRRGAITMMTRSQDRFIELDRRAAIAEENKADLFVSIHADIARPGIKGATVLIGQTASSRSKRAAAAIRTALQRAGIPTRPTRSQNLRVCQGHSRPAVLVECGFMSNNIEAANLNTAGYQKKIAKAIADGIAEFF